MATSPFYDNIRKGGPEGIREPMESQNSTYKTYKTVNHSYGTGHSDWVLTSNEQAGSFFDVTGTTDATGAKAIFPGADPGRSMVVFNETAQAITFLVSGQTGIAVASGKKAVLIFGATDILRVTADT